MEDKQNTSQVTQEDCKVDEISNVRGKLDKIAQDISVAEQRSISVSDEFIRLEVQVATILFAFSSLFLDKFNRDHFPHISDTSLFTIRFIFAFSLLFLIISFAWGLLHLKNRELFCGRVLSQRIRRYSKWEEVTQCKATFKEAEAFHEGSSLGNGVTVKEADWTWILQTICLSIGVGGLFVLSVIYLFNQ